MIRPTPPSLPAAVCTAPVPCGAAEEGPGLDLVAPNDLPDLEIKILTKAIDDACATSCNERALLGEDGGGGGGGDGRDGVGGD